MLLALVALWSHRRRVGLLPEEVTCVTGGWLSEVKVLRLAEEVLSWLLMLFVLCRVLDHPEQIETHLARLFLPVLLLLQLLGLFRLCLKVELFMGWLLLLES